MEEQRETHRVNSAERTLNDSGIAAVAAYYVFLQTCTYFDLRSQSSTGGEEADGPRKGKWKPRETCPGRSSTGVIKERAARIECTACQSHLDEETYGASPPVASLTLLSGPIHSHAHALLPVRRAPWLRGDQLGTDSCATDTSAVKPQRR